VVVDFKADFSLDEKGVNNMEVVVVFTSRLYYNLEIIYNILFPGMRCVTLVS